MKKQIEICIFGKTRKAQDGRKFTTYFTTMPGESEKVKVKFREEAGSPKETPCNIILTPGDCNMSEERYTVELVDKASGEITTEKRYSRVLWVNAWKKSETPYVDTSMDSYFND